MPPIPVHSTSPINANVASHPAGTSPMTAAPQDAASGVAPAAMTTTAASASSYRPAQPGAPAVPQPTNAVASTSNSRLQPTSTVPLPPTTTTEAGDGGPPPPQPGAVPSPYTAPAPRPSVPLPPRPLDIPHWTPSSASPVVQHPASSPSLTHSKPLPLQSPSVYNPVRAVPPAGVTSTYPQDLSHPPGYIQDHSASFDDKPIEARHERRASNSPSSWSRRGGILDGDPGLGSADNNSSNGENTVLDTAMSWAKAAGQRLSETEKQIWKTINGENDS